MKHNIVIAVLSTFVFMLQGCSHQEIKVNGFVLSVEEKSSGLDTIFCANYNYRFYDRVYANNYCFKSIDEYVYGDSIIVILDKNQPQKSRPDSVFFRRQEIDVPHSAINDLDNENPVFSYNSLSEKPIFAISQSADNNKEKLREHIDIKRNELKIKNKGMIGVKLFISKCGTFEKVEILKPSGDVNLDEFVKKTIMSLPKGSPGKSKEGEAVRTSLIMEFRLN